MGNNHYVMDSIQRGEPERLEAFVAWLLGRGQGLRRQAGQSRRRRESGSKRAGNATGLDDTVEHFAVTPRQIIQGVAQAVTELGLPHPVHIHCNNLGLPGNWATTLETMKALEGRRGHLTHIQFHSYGGEPDDDAVVLLRKFRELAEYVNAHANLTVDVGQVLFGETTSMTGDGPLGYLPAQGDRPQVVQRRHRNGGRLRHRADRVQGQEPRPRAAMGDRPGVVSAGRRSLADRHEHRSPQRRRRSWRIRRSSPC